jgi:hypothetical protein
MKIILLFCTFLTLTSTLFSQTMHIFTKTGDIPIKLSDVDSITFVTGTVFEARPNFLNIPAGGMMTSTIVGGKMPYGIARFPDSTIASAFVNNNFVTVNGYKTGSTDVMIVDNSTPQQYLTIGINVGGGGSGLTANPPSVQLLQGTNTHTIISGGTPPYWVQLPPDPMIASAFLSGNDLSIYGNNVGSTFVEIKDASSPSKTVAVWIYVDWGMNGLSMNPMNMSIEPGNVATSTVGGGTGQYRFIVQPDSSVASAFLSGATITVTGINSGKTFLIIGDQSTPMKTGRLEIQVRTKFTTPGTLSFLSTVKNFSANGILDINDGPPSNSSGAGAMKYSDGGINIVQVIGYNANSSTSYDVAFLMIVDPTAISTSMYNFKPMRTDSVVAIKSAGFFFFQNINPNDTINIFDIGQYVLNTGSLAVSAVAANSIQGSYNGTGALMNGLTGILDPTKPITVSSGTFNTPMLMSFSADQNVRSMIKRLSQKVQQYMLR